MPEKFAVLGDGAWGTAVALLLAQDPGRRVCIWSAFEENAKILRERRENVRLLPGVPIPPAIELTTDPAAALAGADFAVAAIPTVYLRNTLQRFATETGLRLVAPPVALCGDNAAMIAWAGLERLRLGLVDDLSAPARARWPLDTRGDEAGARA